MLRIGCLLQRPLSESQAKRKLISRRARPSETQHQNHSTVQTALTRFSCVQLLYLSAISAPLRENCFDFPILDILDTLAEGPVADPEPACPESIEGVEGSPVEGAF